MSADEFAKELEKIPTDEEFSRQIDPPRDDDESADIPWLPGYLECVYGWSRKGPRP